MLNNIYVADGRRDLILVYSPQGHFRRSIGDFKRESMFDSPSGLALDRKAGHIFVLDTPANQLLMLDLEGKVLRKIGGEHNRDNRSILEAPTEIALGSDKLVVLDQSGSRIQVFDLQCNLLNAFVVRHQNGTPVNEIGLSLDSRSNIYLSNVSGAPLKIFDPSGRLIGGVERAGPEEFNNPSGMWIDPTDRIYVSDTGNSRVQVFQVPGHIESSVKP